MLSLNGISPVNQVYLVLYDRQTPRVGIEYPSPIDNSTQQQTVEITDPTLLAKIEDLQASVAQVHGLTRAPAVADLLAVPETP